MAQKLGSFFGSHTKSLSLKVKEEEEKKEQYNFRACTRARKFFRTWIC